MRKLNVNFKNDAGEQLAGILDLPEAPPRAYALFAHCFTCSKNLRAATNISQSLTAAGYAVLRFDFTGLGQSEGDIRPRSWSCPRPRDSRRPPARRAGLLCRTVLAGR